MFRLKSEILNKYTLYFVAGMFGTLFLGYCIYFDQQRRKNPDYKKKLRERRSAAVKGSSKKKYSKFPNPADVASVQRFFLQEVRLGEEFLAKGDLRGGVEHIANAVTVCGQPAQLMNVVQQTLPPQIYYMLVEHLHTRHANEGREYDWLPQMHKSKIEEDEIE